MKKDKKKCLVIYNPNSGNAISEYVINEYEKILNDNGYSVDFAATKHTNHATEIVQNAQNYDIVFSIGGDGTLNEVVKGNFSRKDKLIICPIPSGTCNDVAAMLGYKKDPIDNLKTALNGEVHNMDIGTINDNPFVYVVGMGKLMNIPYETKGIDKKKNGYGAYIKEFLNEITNKIKRYKAEVIVDGVKLNDKYSLIMVSNSNHIAGINHFYKEVCLNDGQLEVLLCKAKSIKGFIKNFLSFLFGKQSNDIVSLKASEISIRLIDIPEKNWCIDGEKLDYFGNEYVIKAKQKMKILAPKNKANHLFKYN